MPMPSGDSLVVVVDHLVDVLLGCYSPPFVMGDGSDVEPIVHPVGGVPLNEPDAITGSNDVNLVGVSLV